MSAILRHSPKTIFQRFAAGAIYLLVTSIMLSAIGASAQQQSKAAPKQKEKISGISKEDYENLYLGDDDMPGLKMTQNSKGMGPDDGDKIYAKLGGLHTGLTCWEPKKEHESVNHMNRVVDLRWVFPDAASAKAYVKDQLPVMAEHFDAVKSPPKVGEESWVYGGVLDLHLGGDPLRNYIIVFRQNNVVVKFYAAEYTAKGDLRPLTMIPICQKIVDRIKAVEKDK